MRKLSDYIELFDVLRRTVIPESKFSSEPSLEHILRNPRLIIAISHSTPLSIIPAVSLLGCEIAKAGGSTRVPFGIVDKWYYKHPLTSMIANYITQIPEPIDFETALKILSEDESRDLVIFPEGANTFFGNKHEIQPFRSNRFIELSILTQSPILICVHKGSENWGAEIPLTEGLGKSLAPLVLPFSKFFGNKIQSEEKINVPQLPSKIESFKMHCEVWLPGLYEADLDQDPEGRKEQLAHEGEKIRGRMQDLFDEL